MRACLYGVCKCRETAEIDGRSAESFNCRNYNHRFVGEDKQPREKEFLNSHHQLLCAHSDIKHTLHMRDSQQVLNVTLLHIKGISTVNLRLRLYVQRRHIHLGPDPRWG